MPRTIREGRLRRTMATGNERLVIVGGGLTGSLIALALTRLRPEMDFLLIEQAGYFGGGPIAPFFRGAVPTDAAWLIDPLIVAEWPSYYVGFDGFSVTVDSKVAYLIQEQIHAEVVQSVAPNRYRIGAVAVGGNARAVQLADGESIDASLVIDARGDFPAADPGSDGIHILNRLVQFAEPHLLDRPIIMDAAIRTSPWAFLQYLPVAPKQLLIRYVGAPPDAAMRSFASDPGLAEGGQVVREFRTFQPFRLPPVPDMARAPPGWIQARSAIGTLWHPTLSSHVACAARIALEIGRRPSANPVLLAAAIAGSEAAAVDRASRLSALIAAVQDERPEIRTRALRHFYGFDPATIARFDSEKSSSRDYVRMNNVEPSAPTM